MTTFTAFEAKSKFGELLRLVRSGEEILITWRNIPVARIVPEERHGLDERKALVTRLLGSKLKLNRAGMPPISIKQLIEDGRK